MEEKEFEKYYERIKGCFVGCEIIKNSYSRNTIKEILEEIYNKGYEDGFGYLIDGKEAKP